MHELHHLSWCDGPLWPWQMHQQIGCTICTHEGVVHRRQSARKVRADAGSQRDESHFAVAKRAAIVGCHACLLLAESSQHAFAFYAWYLGAQRRAQFLDFTDGLALFNQKYMGTRSRGSIAQCDIASYYDNIGMYTIARWLCTQNFEGFIAALVRVHVLVLASLSAGLADWNLPLRATGLLTGSMLRLK